MNWVVSFCCKKSVLLTPDLITPGCLSSALHRPSLDVGWFGVSRPAFFLIGSCLSFGILPWRRMVSGSGLDSALSCENIWIVSSVSSFFVTRSESKCRIHCGWNIDEFRTYFAGSATRTNALNLERGFCIFYAETILARSSQTTVGEVIEWEGTLVIWILLNLSMGNMAEMWTYFSFPCGTKTQVTRGFVNEILFVHLQVLCCDAYYGWEQGRSADYLHASFASRTFWRHSA